MLTRKRKQQELASDIRQEELKARLHALVQAHVVELTASINARTLVTNAREYNPDINRPLR